MKKGRSVDGLADGTADSQHGKATLVGDRGSLIEREYVVNLAIHGYGACLDSNRKSYRLMF